MCGLAFSGKTTLATAIAKRAAAAVVSLDDINAARGLQGGVGISDNDWTLTHQQALESAETALANGQSVVVDDTNCFRFLRDNFRAVAKRHGVATVVVYCEVPLSIAMGRMRANEISPTRPPVTEAVLAELARKFEPPESDERTHIFQPDSDVASWVKSNIPLH
jgi:predicted kinase